MGAGLVGNEDLMKTQVTSQSSSLTQVQPFAKLHLNWEPKSESRVALVGPLEDSCLFAANSLT